jgi:hypothetical protein
VSVLSHLPVRADGVVERQNACEGLLVWSLVSFTTLLPSGTSCMAGAVGLQGHSCKRGNYVLLGCDVENGRHFEQPEAAKLEYFLAA